METKILCSRIATKTTPGLKTETPLHFLISISKSKFNLQALREEEKMRNRVNKRLPKAVEDITNWMDELQKKGMHFRIRGMTFDELNAYQGTIHTYIP